MKIKTIQLHNIGLYKNDIISFPSSGKKDVMLAWGNNGAGKTTLINSIKVGLLGKEAFQISYPEYCQFIKDKLITTRCDKSNVQASIRIEIEISENNSKVDYLLERSWKLSGDDFEENIQVFQGTQQISYEKKEQVLNTIARLLPPSLLDVIIFDGENAINILNEGKMSSLIKTIIYSVFGMDVYSGLSKDLSSFLRSGKSNGETSTEERMSFITLENEYKNAHSNVEKMNKLLKQENDKKVALLREISYTSKRFSDKTGIKIEGIEEINASINDAKSQKEKMDSDIKYINEEILPLKMVHSRIKEALSEIDKERPYLVLKNIEELKKYFSETKPAIELIEKLEQYVPEDSGEIKHNLSDSEYKVLSDMNQILKNYSKSSLLQSVEQKNDFMQEVRNKLEIAEKVQDPSSRELIKKIETSYEQLQETVNLVNELTKENDKYTEELFSIKNEYDLRKSIITKQKKESDSYLAAFNYRDVIDRFIEENVNSICSDLNRHVEHDLHKMKFRNNSIGKVDISPKSFEINLYEKDGSLIPSELFSAGEKQVLLGLIIKDSLSISNVDTFFLFDTPVGRLDMENRKVFTNEVIFNVADQVAVFATNSDYTKGDYKGISSRITKEVMLKRDSNDQIIAVEGGIYKGGGE